MNKRSSTRSQDKQDKPVAKKAASSRRASTASSRAVRKSRNNPTPIVDDGVRRAMVAQAAYFRAERRGFIPGRDVEDWIEAEREIDRMLGR